MAASESLQNDRGALGQVLEFVRTTVIGGALFLLPIFVVIFVTGKVFGLMGGLTDPLARALRVERIAGIAVTHLITIFFLLLLAFVAGLFARTRAGQSALAWIREGVAATFPQFSLLQDVAQRLGNDANVEDIPVVLVPTDAGWTLGLLLEAQGEWHAVYIPGSPQISSGSVSYAHASQVHRTDLTLKQLWVMLRGRGKGSAEVYRQLAILQSSGKL